MPSSQIENLSIKMYFLRLLSILYLGSLALAVEHQKENVRDVWQKVDAYNDKGMTGPPKTKCKYN